MTMRLSKPQLKMLLILADGVEAGHNPGTGTALQRRGLVRQFGTFTSTREYDETGVAIGDEVHSGFITSWQLTDAGREALAGAK